MSRAKRKPSSLIKKPSTLHAAAVEVTIDVALKRAWKSAHAAFESASREGMRAFDRKYEAVGDIIEHEPALYLAAGLSTLRAFVQTYLPAETERTVLRNVRVARYASPDEEARYTPTKIDAAIDFLEAKLGGQRPKGRIPVDFERLRIPLPRAKPDAAASVLFPNATILQIRAAARALRGAKGKPSKFQPPVVQALRKQLPKGAEGVALAYANGKVSIGGIPVEKLGAVLRALAKARLPKP